MEKRVLIAIALSFALLGFYPFVLEKFYPGYSSSKSVSSKPAAVNLASPETTHLKSSPLDPAAFSEKEDIVFKNDSLKLLFNQRSGAIRGISFREFIDYRENIPLTFLSLGENTGAPTALRFLEGVATDEKLSHYEMRQSSENTLEATALGDKLKVTKKYVFKKGGYDAALNIVFENLSSAPVELRYELFAGSSVPPRHSIDRQYIEANFYSKIQDKEVLRHIRESKQGKIVTSDGPIEWVAIKDRHFSVIVKPKSEGAYTGNVEGLGHENFNASLVSPRIVAPAGGSISHEFLLYIGPNQIERLEPLGLGPVVNFGRLDWIGKLLVGTLELLNKIFRNYGLAIIVLTALINLLFFPLTRLSFMSMKRMQDVQPQVAKLREQHKNSPEKINKEMMGLYKKHKVNPFGGCLPLVIQMPIFMALYVALSKTVVLIDSKLFWIKDLSSPDDVSLPFALPFLGATIHLLPVIMIGAMVVQQKFTQVSMASQDPTMQMQQKMMAFMMPIVFGFIFYTMPSGLVLYWLTNTVIMTAYQFYLKRTH